MTRGLFLSELVGKNPATLLEMNSFTSAFYQVCSGLIKQTHQNKTKNVSEGKFVSNQAIYCVVFLSERC